MYIQGTIEGIPLLFTTDTGATKTIISEKTYARIPPDRKPQLTKSPRLSGAGGTPLMELGKAVFEIQLGPLQLQREIIVAKIEDDALLGIDILQNEADGPADIMLSKGIIRLKGHEIPCIQEGMQSKARKVSCADYYEVPGYCEAVIDVYVERYEDDEESSCSEYLIEPTGNHSYPIQVASTLVDIKDQVTNKVRVLNPFPDTAVLNQNAVIGRAEQVVGTSLSCSNLKTPTRKITT